MAPTATTRTRTAAPPHCAGRPATFPFRCDTCPVLAWPAGGASQDALRDFVNHARCPHDNADLQEGQ